MDKYGIKLSKNMLLEIKNLKVKFGDKEILKGVNFNIKPKEKVVLLGPNGSGKTVLAQVIAGNRKYKINQGKIVFSHKDISNLSPEKITKMGISLAWQAPPKIPGVKFQDFLSKISKSKIINDIENFDLKISSILENELNTNISGGEKKISELLQAIVLKPKLAIFDEIDSGLDMKNLKRVCQLIEKELLKKGAATLFITHNGHILNYFKPDKTLVMVDGKIICQSKNYQQILKTIKKYGYEKCKKCQFSSNRP